MTFTKGERVMLTCGERTVEATVTIASPNGKSLMLAFDAGLWGRDGMHLGMMPVLQGEDGVYRSIMDETEIEIRRVQ